MDDLFSSFKVLGRFANRVAILAELEKVGPVSAILGPSSDLAELWHSDGIGLLDSFATRRRVLIYGME